MDVTFCYFSYLQVEKNDFYVVLFGILLIYLYICNGFLAKLPQIRNKNVDC